MHNIDEKLFVARAKQGDKEALSKLWDIITPKLFGYLVNTTKNKTLAEDVLQNSWLKAITALPDFNTSGAGFSAWLFMIARNELRQHWRKQGREIPYESDTHDIVSEQTEKSVNNILLDQILTTLPPEDQELIRLHYIADLPLKEIAQLLKLNFVTVRVRIHRAKARMRDALVRQNHE